jgi:hypothetical protein
MKNARDQEDARILIEKLQKALTDKSGSRRRFIAITVNEYGLFSIQGAGGIRLKPKDEKGFEDRFTGETVEGAINKLLTYLQEGGTAVLKLDENRDQFDATFGYENGEWVIYSALRQSYEYHGSLDD